MGVAFSFTCVCVCAQVTEDIKRFKGQGVELEEKRRTILRDLEVHTHTHTHTHSHTLTHTG